MGDGSEPRRRVDWVAARKGLRLDRWFLVGRMPKSTYEAARAGRVKAMRGVALRVRNQSRAPDGRLWVDVYAKWPDESEEVGDGGTA